MICFLISVDFINDFTSRLEISLKNKTPHIHCSESPKAIERSTVAVRLLQLLKELLPGIKGILEPGYEKFHTNIWNGQRAAGIHRAKTASSLLVSIIQGEYDMFTEEGWQKENLYNHEKKQNQSPSDLSGGLFYEEQEQLVD